MDIIFLNSGNSTISDHRLILNLSDKIYLNREDTFVPLSSLTIYYTWKNCKTFIKTINLDFLFRISLINMKQ